MKKISEYVRITAFFLILVLLPVLAYALPKKTFSPEENRTLAKAPVLRMDTYLDRTFMNGVESDLADHFPARTTWVEGKALTQLALGMREVGGVYVTNNRFLAVQTPTNEAYFQKNLDTLRDFAAAYETKPVVLMVPDNAAMLDALVPANAPVSTRLEEEKTLENALGASCVCVDIQADFRAHQPEDLYYHTDHHWTSLGAYRAYVALGDAMGYTPYDRSAFTVEQGTEPFYGSLYSKCLIKTGITADKVALWTRKDNPPAFSVADRKGTILSDSLFFREKLNEKDQYLTFLGENRDVTVITRTKGEKTGKNLLVIKDSYANSLVQFLALHYDSVTLVDPRYYRGELEQVAEKGQFDTVLFCFGTESILSQNALAKLIF